MRSYMPFKMMLQLFAENDTTTTTQDIFKAEVCADIISGKIANMIAVTPFARIDNTLEGQAGNSVTLPKWGYIGDAEDVAEGEQIPIEKMSSTTAKYEIKKTGRGASLTDEARLSGYGDPQGEALSQVAKAIASKMDTDALDALYLSKNYYTSSTIIGYDAVVSAIDMFAEELMTEKVMFVHPSQVTQLRKDADFKSADKYDNKVVMTGEIGMISGVRIVPSRRVVKNALYHYKDASGNLTVVESGATSGQINLADVKPQNGYTPAVGDKVKAVAAGTYWMNPIVKLNGNSETDSDLPALTIYMKRRANVEVERKAGTRTTEYTADQIYVAALTNESKVVLARMLVAAAG